MATISRGGVSTLGRDMIVRMRKKLLNENAGHCRDPKQVPPDESFRAVAGFLWNLR